MYVHMYVRRKVREKTVLYSVRLYILWTILFNYVIKSTYQNTPLCKPRNDVGLVNWISPCTKYSENEYYSARDGDNDIMKGYAVYCIYLSAVVHRYCTAYLIMLINYFSLNSTLKN